MRPARGRPAVSIVLPFRDAEATLGSTLDSLAAQTFEDFEVLCVDDGSQDRGPAEVRDRQGRDPRFRLISGPGAGLVAALNQGLSEVRAPLVARMDADDLALPERLARQWAFLQDHPDVAVLDSRVEIFRDDGPLGGGMARYQRWLDGITHHEDFARELLVESPIAHPAVMVRSAWLERVGGYRQGDFPEDYDLWLRLFRAGARFHKLPERLLRWRDHSTRATRTDSRYRREAFVALKLEHLLELGRIRGGSSSGLALWGAGPTSRPWRRMLAERGASPERIYDIDPKKFGRRLRGVTVCSADELTRSCHELVLVMVGAPGARGLIREALLERGLVEGEGFVCVA